MNLKLRRLSIGVTCPDLCASLLYLDRHIHLIVGTKEWVKRGSFMSNDVSKHGCKTDEFPYLSILFYIKLFEYPPSNIIKHPIFFPLKQDVHR